MRFLALVCAFFAAAPLGAVEVARVRVAPVNNSMAAAVGARARMGSLAGPSLTGGASLSITSKLGVPSLVPTVIPTAQEALAGPAAGGYTPAAVAGQTISGMPVSGAPALAPASVLTQNAEQQNAPAAAVSTLQNLVARMESSRVSGRDISSELSGRFFDQSGTRGPPLAAPASVSDVSAPKLPPGATKVSVGTVRSAADVDRLIPMMGNSKTLISVLKRDVARMAPYDIYTYHDSKGGVFTGIDLSAKPALLDQLPDLQPHEVRLIKKLILVNSDIRVLVREEGKTPDLVVGDKLVELKSFAGASLPLESLIAKANRQILEHGRLHGLGRGALAVDLTQEKTVPVARIRGLLNTWQKGSQTPVVLDQVMVFGQTDMQVFMRQPDGTYEIGAAPAPARSLVKERPLAPSERGRAQAMLRNGIEKSPVLALSL
ncbi:MAG: hypothetical protein PHU21_13670 [Elusimicrobia bacterium]|jgi:hypothetical protein|nr:hypothetical protein [Elusimicrobiota bacterium]